MVRISSRLRASKPFLLRSRSCSLVMVDVGTRVSGFLWGSGEVTEVSWNVSEGAMNCAPTLGVLDCAKAMGGVLGEGAMNCAPTLGLGGVLDCEIRVYCWMTGLYKRDSVIRRSWSLVKRLSRK